MENKNKRGVISLYKNYDVTRKKKRITEVFVKRVSKYHFILFKMTVN